MRVYLRAQCIVFGAFATSLSVTFAQSTVITGKTFGVSELEILLKKSEGNVELKNCKVTPSPSVIPGMDTGSLLVPANIRFLTFSDCAFSESFISFESPLTELYLYKVTGVSSLEIGTSGRVEVLECTFRAIVINRADTGVEYERIAPRTLIEGSHIERIRVDDIRGSNAALIISRSTIGTLTVNNCQLSPLGFVRSTNFAKNDNRYFHISNMDSLLLRTTGTVPYTSEAHRFRKATFVGFQYMNLCVSGSSINTLSLNNVSSDQSVDAALPIYNCVVDNLSITLSAVGNLDLFGTTVTQNLTVSHSTIGQMGVYRFNLNTINIPGLTFDKLLGRKLFIYDPTNSNEYSKALTSKTGHDSTRAADYGYHYLLNQSNPVKNETPRIDTIRFRKIDRYFAVRDDEIRDVEKFNELITQYSHFYQLYRSRGDIISANQCYAEMKDIQTARLRILYDEDGSFNNFIRWQLANVVKVYTNHGTDPARAIVISFWVILGFAVFYFFYPSDWDVTSKSRLLRDFRDFRAKNEKGYIKPFGKLTAGFVISLINALTLSLNAFVTLGFGNIPTHGVARYMTIIEGFFGWFLLSIFTVALINQVLA
jgi:hypothetical protein